MKSRRTRRLKRRVSRKRRTRRTRRLKRRVSRKRRTRRTTQRRTTQRRATQRRRGGARSVRRSGRRSVGLPLPPRDRSRSPPLLESTSSDPIEIQPSRLTPEIEQPTLTEQWLNQRDGRVLAAAKVKGLPKTPPKYAPPPADCGKTRVLSGHTEPSANSRVECAVDYGSNKMLPSDSDTPEELKDKKRVLEKWREAYTDRNAERRKPQLGAVAPGFSGRAEVMALVKMCRAALFSGPPAQAVDTCEKAVAQMPPVQVDNRGRPIVVIDGKPSIEPEALTMLRSTLEELLAQALEEL